MRAYRMLQRFLRFATTIFFRRIEIVGAENIPEGVPVIFCGNHPNSLLDPALITAWCGRVVHFAAKDVLFRSAPLRVLLNAAGAVPIKRAKDHDGAAAKAAEAEAPAPSRPVDNAEAFEQLYAVLARGRAMGIFPEGISHDESQLVKLKTGAARIAFWCRQGPPRGAVLVGALWVTLRAPPPVSLQRAHPIRPAHRPRRHLAQAPRRERA